VTPPDANDADPATLWKGTAARGWVELEELLDRLFRPIEDALVAAVLDAAPTDGARVLDVGCGTGVTTVALARRLGPGAACTGIDISEAMLDAARARAEREGVDARFVVADAQRHRFESATIDVVTSRFGIMFFDDPVAAFSNLRRATASGGALRAVVWRGADENPFMDIGERAAAGLLDIPPRPLTGPGAFALADPVEVRDLLGGAGWSDVEAVALDLVCTMPESELGAYATGLGPLGRALTAADADAELRARVEAAVVPAYAEYLRDGQVHLPVACWMLRAAA